MKLLDRLMGRTRKPPACKAGQIAQRFKQLLAQETELANKHLTDPYWTHDNHNVGNDELAALSMAESVECLPHKYADPDEFVTALIRQLLDQKQSYGQQHEDPEGYGAGTFWSIIRGLVEYAETIGVAPAFNPLKMP